MANNKLFGIKSAYILLLALMVGALCLPATVCAYSGEPVLKYDVSTTKVVPGGSGTATVTITETGGYDYAANVIVSLSTDTPGVSFGNQQTISKIGEGGTKTLTFPINVDSSVKGGTYTGNLKIDYKEYGAMDIGTYSHIIRGTFYYTVAEKPSLKSQVSVPQVVAGKSNTATVTISETGGQSPAQNVKVTLSTDTPGVSFGSTQTIYQLNAGGKQTLNIPIYTDPSVEQGKYSGKIKVDYHGQSNTDTFEYTVIGVPVINYKVAAESVSGKSGTAAVTIFEVGGKSPAQNVQVTLSTDTPGVTFGYVRPVSQIDAGGQYTFSIPIRTTSAVKPGTYLGNLKINSDNYISSENTFQYTIVGEPVIKSQVSVPDVTISKGGTATVSVSETGGQGSAQNVKVSLSTDTQGVSFGKSQTISQLSAGGKQILSFPISVASSAKAGTYTGKIIVDYNGQSNTDSFKYTIVGNPVLKYQVYIPDVVSGDSGTATVTVSETSLECSVQNVVVTLSTDTRGVSFGGSQTIPELSAGGSKTLTFPIYTTSEVKPGSYLGKAKVDGNGQNFISTTFPYTVIAPSISESVSRIASGKSPLSPITIIIACIVTAFVAVYTGSRRERK